MPVTAKSLSVPTDHGIGDRDEQCAVPIGPPSRQSHPEQAVGGRWPGPFAGVFEQGDLLAQREVLQGEGSVSLNRGNGRLEE